MSCDHFSRYFGVSSNGITYKSGSALTSSSSSLGYGGFGSSKSQGNLANTYKELNKSTKGITRRCRYIQNFMYNFDLV